MLALFHDGDGFCILKWTEGNKIWFLICFGGLIDFEIWGFCGKMLKLVYKGEELLPSYSQKIELNKKKIWDELSNIIITHCPLSVSPSTPTSPSARSSTASAETPPSRRRLRIGKDRKLQFGHGQAHRKNQRLWLHSLCSLYSSTSLYIHHGLIC